MKLGYWEKYSKGTADFENLGEAGILWLGACECVGALSLEP